MVKISTFMMSMVVAALFMTVLGSYYANIATNYPVTYDENTSEALAGLNKLTEIQETTNEINASLFATSVSGTDLIGKFLGSGFAVTRLARQSFQAFYEMASTAIGAIGLPGIFTDVIITLALIAFIFIIISMIVGRDI